MTPAKTNLEEIFEAQIRTLALTLRPGTVFQYRSAAHHFLTYLRAAFPQLHRLSQLHRDPHLLGWFRSLSEQQPPLSNSTRIGYLICLRRLLDDLTANGHPLQPDVNGAGVFAPDVLRSELDIEHGGRNLGMAHQLLQGRQGHPGTHHIRSKRVPHAVGISVMDLTAQSMMAEQGTKPRCSQGLATLAAFERDEQGGRVGQRTFQAQIMSQDFEDLRGQRQEAFLVSFAVDAHLSVGELQVLQFQGQDLTRAQAVEEHQPDQCEIAVGAEALPELGDFFGGERHDDPPLLFEAKSPSDGGARPAVAEGGSSGVATLEMHLAGGNLLTGMEAIA